MKFTSICLVMLLAVSLLPGAQGTVPLKKAADYRNHVEIDGMEVGALILNSSQMKQRFVADLNREYLVVEVALYPKTGAELKLQPEKFVLRIAGDDRAIQSENPQVIAASLQKSGESKRDISIVPVVGVGYETGTRGYNPTTGTTRRSGGLYTSTGVAVVVGDSPPSNPKNEDVMTIELSEKGLPEGTYSKPVAGHLYFRVGKSTFKDNRAKFELTLELDGKETTLALKR
jgi:hypothetical protein